MDFKFPKLGAFLGITSASAEVTETNLTQAEGKIAQLETQVTTAEAAKVLAEQTLATVQGQLTTAKADLVNAQQEVTTLEGYKREQAQLDGRTEDESNEHDEPQGQALTGFEAAAAKAIASAQKRVGEAK